MLRREKLLPVLRTFLAIGVSVSPLGVTACTSTANDPAAALSLSASADLALPPTMTIVPSARAVPAGKQVATTAVPFAGIEKPAAVTASTAVFASPAAVAVAPTGPRDVEGLIAKYAALYDVPVDLVRRVVKRESNFRPTAYNRRPLGPDADQGTRPPRHGLSGAAERAPRCRDAPALSGQVSARCLAVAGGNRDRAVRFYASGYYYDAKRSGLLDETGLGVDRRRRMAPTI